MTSEAEIPVVPAKGRADVIERIRALGRSQLHAVLGTDDSGRPYLSLMAFALTPDARYIVMASARDTAKYKNIRKNKTVSVLIDGRTNTADDYTKAESVTVLGSVRIIGKGRRREALSAILKKKHPALKGFIEAPTTAILLIKMDRIVHVGGFQEVTTWEATMPPSAGPFPAERFSSRPKTSS